MTQIRLTIPKKIHKIMWAHLLPPYFKSEEAGFMYVKRGIEDNTESFECVEWYPVPCDGFKSRSPFHLELTDETRATVIKRAHDLGASLVELHSHMGNGDACFSSSDLVGFQEFVPHVWWRLKHKPYFALVLTRTGFDGLAWLADSTNPLRIDEIIVGNTVLASTKLSPFKYDGYE